mmetsp:Transcript_15848/g.40900  ORF Transcript_15848/g.40900 Transcript_15848/m.40900 type:complete len:220 (-) Transcript_15848:285-944(-)
MTYSHEGNLRQQPSVLLRPHLLRTADSLRQRKLPLRLRERPLGGVEAVLQCLALVIAHIGEAAPIQSGGSGSRSPERQQGAVILKALWLQAGLLLGAAEPCRALGDPAGPSAARMPESAALAADHGGRRRQVRLSLPVVVEPAAEGGNALARHRQGLEGLSDLIKNGADLPVCGLQPRRGHKVRPCRHQHIALPLRLFPRQLPACGATSEERLGTGGVH